jgi:uncharacterized protein (TIGR03067 family)
MKRLVPAVALLPVILLLGTGPLMPVRGQDKPASKPAWEWKAVALGAEEKEATKKLNELATDGWEYVGPLAHGLVAFKRPKRPAEEIELEKLQGTWILVSRAEGGQVVPAKDDSITFTFTGNKWTWKNGDTLAQAGILKLVDLNNTPKSYDNECTDGVNKGAKAKGIYQVEGDTFKYCEGANRPTDFTTKAGDGTYCCTWKRAKK